jgi:cell division protein FtsL
VSHAASNLRLQINARLVKEKDRARARELRRLLLCGAAIVVPLLVYVWQRVEFLRVSYEVEALKKERQQLQEQNKQLTVERSFLLSPDRIERLARKELGLVDPSPTDVRRVAVIDGKINEVGTEAEAAGGGDGAVAGAPSRPQAGAAAKKARRPRRKPAPPKSAGTTDETAVEAGVGMLPLLGTATPRSQQPEETP